GKSIEGKIIVANDSLIEYEYLKKKNTKRERLEPERVFSIKYANGDSIILYTKDTTIGHDFTVSEMHYFILGEQDAFIHYKDPATGIIGIAVGAAGGLIYPYFSLAA